jgi:ATP-dependent exoDNAse (exonuclease V) beta subunit
VLEARDALMQALDLFQLHADADLAALLHGELLACVDRYQRLKAQAGALDFLDLLLHARDLIRGNAPVRNHFQARFRCLFVDEFQDTDPLQAELLLLLASKDPGETRWQDVDPVPGKLFLVGDPKQSIYRFRRADVAIYRRVCELLVDRGATFVELRKSFRSVENIQRVVNAAFEPLMDGNVETRQARYVPLEPSRADEMGQPSVVALPVPKPYAQRFVSARAIEESLPDAVGAYVEWLVNHSNRRDRAPRFGQTGSARSATHLHSVPKIRELRRGHHARVRGRARGARSQAPAGWRPRVSRTRGDRDAARCAHGHRVAG